MAAIASTMLPLETPVPPFTLVDAVQGRSVSIDEFRGSNALLVMFICNHCPYVVRVRDEFARLERDYAPRGVAIVAINANSEKTHPQDGPEAMKRLAVQLGWGFPFLFDATQEVAKAFRAACTPEFYVFDGERKLAYRGQLDDARPSNDAPVTGRDVRNALEAVLSGQRPLPDQKPSIGCNIKWHPER